MAQTARQFTLDKEESMVMILEPAVLATVEWLEVKMVPRSSQIWPSPLPHRLYGVRVIITTLIFSMRTSAFHKDRLLLTAIHIELSPTRAVLRYPRQTSQAQAAQAEQEAMADKMAWTILQAQACKSHQSHPNHKA